MRYEQTKNGKTFLCGAILPLDEIHIRQRWIGSSGNIVTVTGVDRENEWIEYTWTENGGERKHEKQSFAFQCRYCLIIREEMNETHENV